MIRPPRQTRRQRSRSGSTTHGAGLVMVPILALQEVLTVGLYTLGCDEHAIAKFLARDDALQYGTANEWRDQLREALREMLDPSTDQHCDVIVGNPLPWGAARLPCLSLIIQTGGENTSEAVIGNILRQSSEFHGPNDEAWETTETGAGQTTSVEISAWSPSVERAQLLIGAAKWAIYQQTEPLKRRGIHEITFRELGDQAAPELEPRVGVVPQLSVTLSWTFVQTHRRKIPNRVTIEPGSFS